MIAKERLLCSPLLLSIAIIAHEDHCSLAEVAQRGEDDLLHRLAIREIIIEEQNKGKNNG